MDKMVSLIGRGKWVVLVTALVACGGSDPQGGGRDTEQSACPNDFAVCRASAQSLTFCIGGDCACELATHPGENTPVSCHTGEPDGSYYGIAH